MPLPDHVMVLLDDQTYRDVTACAELAERFARVRPKAADSTLAGRYASLGLAGRNTLLELFAGALPGPRRFTAGLVFSFERPGAVPMARQTLLESAGVPALYELVERADPDGAARRPWYHLLAPDLGEDSSLLLMLNQVTPEYYAGLGARPGPDGALLRREYVDAVFATAPASDRMLGDLVAVTVRLRPARARRLSAVLAALGYRAEDGAVRGPGFTVALELDETAPEGVTEVAMTLTHPPARTEELGFGSGSRLLLDPAGTAVWTFTPVGADELP